MGAIQRRVDDKTLEQAKGIAARRRNMVEALIEDIVQRPVSLERDADPILGMFAQKPELMDAVVVSAMQARESDPLRVPLPTPPRCLARARVPTP